MKTTDQLVLFWTEKDIYSNFYPFEFVHQGMLFHSAEQAIMYRKAKLFGAHSIASTILNTRSPKACKQLGRSRQIPFDETLWTIHRERIFTEILVDKFSNEPLKQQLLRTGEKILAEASPYDTIWGIGIRETDPRALDPSQWKGANLLGKVLMQVRGILKNK